MNKKGFIATSLIYSFFLVFCATLASYVAINIHNKMLLNRVTDQIREDLNSTKYVTDMPVGSYVKFNVKYTKNNADIDTSDLNYNVLSTSTDKITLISNGIFLTLPTEIDKTDYTEIDLMFLDELPFFSANSCTKDGTVYRMMTSDDFNNILNTNNIDIIKTLLNVNTKYAVLNNPDYIVNYFSYDPIKDAKKATESITEYKKYLSNKLKNTTVEDSDPVGVRLVFDINPNIEIKGGDGTDLSPYILESRCYKWKIIKALF